MTRSQQRFKTKDLRTTLEADCLRVLEHFELPAHRLLCFFDDEDPPCFAQRFPGGYRGFHMPVRGSGYFPPYVTFLDSDGDLAFDNVIYLRGRTCAVRTSAIITFAHELQHFVQYGQAQKVFAANVLLYHHMRAFDPTSELEAWDIPHERDAMTVSKRVADAVIGPEAVSVYARSQIDAEIDPHYWEYFQGLSSSLQIDLLRETRPLVEKYRPKLLGLNQTRVDFSAPEWWH